MNGLIKKIGAGLIALMIAITGVASVGTGAYAAGGPCDGMKGTDVNNTAGANRPYECAACLGTALSEGKTQKQAIDLCKDTSEYNVQSIWLWVYRIINWVLIAVGIIAVVFIIIGGIRYATSSGDSDKVKSAKNTILYALIGLVIAILANVIVQIVFQVTGTVTSTS